MSFNSSIDDGVADLNIKSSIGKSPLLLAAENSDETLFVELIEQGADVNCHDGENITPLHHAVYRGWLSVVELLLQKGADPDVTTTWGSTALLIACARRHKDIAELLSKYSKNLDCVTDECHSKSSYLACCTDEDDCCNWTALHFASRYGWQELAKLLVQRGANINAQNSKGKTPLLVAFAYRQGNIIKLLINLGADLRCCGKNKWTILHYAAAHDWDSLVYSLVKKGAEIDAKTAKGLTPLLLAAERGHKYVVSSLVAKGADTKGYNSQKHTVLWFALNHGWLEVLERLEDKGVDFDVELPSGEIPIFMAMADASSWKKRIVQFLIKSGVDLKRCDGKGWTVLHYASRNKWPDVARAVLERGCDVNAMNWSGNTALHIVCDFTRSPNTELTSESVQLVDLLIEKGADVGIKNSHGETPLHLASKYLECPGIGSRGLIIFNCLMNAQCRG